MYCTNCGKTIEDGSDFCPFCGAKQLTASPERKTTGSETVKIMADKKQTSRKKDIRMNWTEYRKEKSV